MLYLQNTMVCEGRVGCASPVYLRLVLVEKMMCRDMVVLTKLALCYELSPHAE